ncbi:multiheme c-type cytochrome [Singulisphaera sp. Ch08]|uniref:Multiheme c-type cytochrome n=1 Tax=Singulisphaera sp. Ch08 TaxID=3120278 RepID=A0AAU7CMY5_9BACT
MRHLRSRLNEWIRSARSPVRGGALLLLGSCLGLACLTAIVAQEVAPQGSSRRDGNVGRIEAVGVSSCASFACHGGNGGEGDHRSAYTIWMALDPHSRAESVLKDKRSIEIEDRLAIFSGREARSAETDARCLGCHVSPGPNPKRPAFVSAPEGVGCESCHGPASKWLKPHSLASWKQLSQSKKVELGMTPTNELEARVNLCVGCHVGQAGRDVDHDLIAAGHPRLDFEFFSYLAALPKHWDDSKERREQPDLDARTWAIGQVVSAREALGLLSLRAHAAQERQVKKPLERSPIGIWPEFAEYACNSCHHPLAETTLPSTRDAKTGLVTLPWGSWYFSIAPALLTPEHEGINDDESSPLASLRRLMESIDPQPKDAERLALEAKSQVGKLLGATRAQFNLRQVQQLLARLVADEPGSPPLSWETATQLYVGIAALNGTLERLGQPPTTSMKTALDELRRQVEAPSLNGPSGRWTADVFKKAMERYRSELSKAPVNSER